MSNSSSRVLIEEYDDPVDEKATDYTKSLTSAMDKYLNICKTAVAATWPFPFKRHADYQAILEHVSATQGEAYWQQIEITCPELLRPHVMKRFLENERWGNPVTHNFQGYELSPTTLRYIKVAADLDRLIGRGRLMNADIVEIGVGYGGLAYVLNAWNPELGTTYLVDLPIVTQLAKKYLGLLPNTQKIQTISTEEIASLTTKLQQTKKNGKLTIGISNYALTECDPFVRRNYIENVLRYCDYGYITVNMLDAQAAKEFQQLVSRSDRMVVRLDEVPLTSPENHIVLWGPKVEAKVLDCVMPHSQSQIGQDRYVTHVLDSNYGKRTYLEIGAHEPRKLNNTFVLEKLGWNGLSLDIDASYKAGFELQRCNAFELADVTTVDWLALFSKHKIPQVIDYLSMDVDEATLATMERFPFDTFQFRIMTVEHDRYRFGPERAASIRAILFKHGYEIVVKDISLQGNPFEDWWYHPKNVTAEEAKRALALKADGIDFARIFSSAKSATPIATTTPQNASVAAAQAVSAFMRADSSLRSELGPLVPCSGPLGAVSNNSSVLQQQETKFLSSWHETMYKCYRMTAPKVETIVSEKATKFFFDTISRHVRGTVDINPPTGVALLVKKDATAFLFESDKALVTRWKKEQSGVQVVAMPTQTMTVQTWNTIFEQRNIRPCNFLRLDSEAISQNFCSVLALADTTSQQSTGVTSKQWNWIQVTIETEEQFTIVHKTLWGKESKYVSGGPSPPDFHESETDRSSSCASGIWEIRYPMLCLLQNTHVAPVNGWMGPGIYVLSDKPLHEYLVL